MSRPTTKINRPWTTLEQRRAVVLRGTGHTLKEVARMLGRPFASVSKKLDQLGVKHPTRTQRKPGELMKAVKRCWKPGRSDSEIGRVLNTTRNCVYAARKRLGLPCGIDHVEAGRRACAAVRHRNFGRCGAALHRERSRVAAFSAGWPTGCTREFAAHLESLRTAPAPLTVRQWASVRGMAVESLRPSTKKAVRQGWVVGSRPTGKRPTVFSLAPDVAARRARTVAYQTKGRP